MIRYSGLKIHIDHSQTDIQKALLKKLRTKKIRLIHFKIIKKSLDARDKNNIHWNYIIDFTTDNDKEVLKANRGRKEFSIPPVNDYRFPMQGNIPYIPAEHGRICVVGAGPAGLFAAYYLAEKGFAPILIERGEAAEERLKTVNLYWEGKQPLNPESNIQFGEGGAGTFSDGKLNTGVNDPSGRNNLVLSTFVKNGAPHQIIYDSKPHIGSDILVEVVRNMRTKILANGGEVYFNTKFLEANYRLLNSGNYKAALESIVVQDLHSKQKRTIACQNLILATGHSARDTFQYLIKETPLTISAKPFSVGIRVQHNQETINQSQYGVHYRKTYGDLLPPADYKLVRHTADGSSVYSFCMCPGGYVVDSSSEPGRLCINGMSYSGRAGKNANSAIVIGVKPSDNPFANIEYQKKLEEKAFQAANGAIPVQTFSDFEKERCSESFGTIMPEFKGAYAFADLHQILDEHLCKILTESMHDFAKKIHNFDAPDTLLSAVESRTSSPIRIHRDEHFESEIRGIYPCGEGAGYAGGITSAAIDGIKVFEEIYKRFSVPVINI